LSNDFDAVIIGAGIGGLTCGAFLARQGVRVAVCEKHSVIGGYAQNFTRKGFSFDSSVHSVPMADHGFVCGLLTELGIRNDLTITPNTCTMHVLSPTMDYCVPADIEGVKQALCKDFPHEKNGVTALLADMQTQFHRYKGMFQDGEFPTGPSVATIDVIESTLSYKDYLGRFIHDDKLLNVFHSIWPYAGISSSYAPMFNALVFALYAIEGSHHVKGGFSALADALAGVIVKNDGEVKTRWSVCGLRIDNDRRVRAVVGADGGELTAGRFVSNVSPFLLHRSMIPESFRSRLWLSRLERLRPSVSSFCVYLGITGDASDIVQDNITFWFGTDDHDAQYNRILSGRTDVIDHLLVMRTPSDGPNSTMTLICIAMPDVQNGWKTAKKKFAEAMIDKAVSLFGDFTPRIAVAESASPATFERYTGNTGGALYGFENAKDLSCQSKLPLTTHLSNLYQAGHWTKSGSGIYNVMSSGRAVASMILNR
jgi:phytoene dehydrogenase-like protein